MPRFYETRLMVKIARMHFVHQMRQQEITKILGIHQSTVSRYIKRAKEANLVRMIVEVPRGLHSELEEQLESQLGLREAIVVDCPDDEGHMIRELGAAAAFHLESTLRSKVRVGISSWSRHLLAMVDQLHPTQRAADGFVVQILGGVGTPEIQSQATQLTQQLARNIGASPVLLQAPGVAGTAKIRDLMLLEPYIRETIGYFPTLDVALVGIGSLKPSAFLERSGNTFTSSEIQLLREAGAVGDICMRFFDDEGNPVRSVLQNRVIGIELATLMRVNRIVGIAGGEAKFRAIKAAVRGKLINVLITDQKTALRLVKK